MLHWPLGGCTSTARRGHRPRDADRTGAPMKFDADVLSHRHHGRGSDGHRHKLGEFACGRPATIPLHDLAPPAMHQVGIDAVRQGDAGDGGTRSGTGRENLSLEFSRVASPRPPRIVFAGRLPTSIATAIRRTSPNGRRAHRRSLWKASGSSLNGVRRTRGSYTRPSIDGGSYESTLSDLRRPTRMLPAR